MAGTSADKLNKLKQTKADIKAAIQEKGQTVSSADTFASYADKIRAITPIEPLLAGIITSIKSDVGSVKVHAFSYCTKLLTAEFPNATVIGANAFIGCEKLTTIKAPMVSKIPSYCHDYNMSLATINYPSATSVGTYAFRDCSVLGPITRDIFPNVETIYTYAFCRTPKLTYADFPKLTSIKSYAFSGAPIEKLILRSPTYCTLENANAFEYGASNFKIYVPSALYDQYAENSSSNPWLLAVKGDLSRIRIIEYESDDNTINGNIAM